MQSLVARRLFEFEGFTLDLARGCLRAGARQIELRPKSFDVLRCLLENAGRVVSKDELVKAVWPNVIVTDDALTHCVSEVRMALADDEQRIVKTVARRGYLLAAPVLAPAADDHKVPDRPLLAVLPFENLSDDTGQEYFANGVVEDITMALSRLHWIFVIARNSSFTYKGRAVNAKQIGHELGARYLLEGSVRKAANKVRITVQLIDTSTGAHLWADRFDGALDDIFDLQDQVTQRVAGAIAPKLQQAEIERAKRKPTGNLDAYDYFLRGLASVGRLTRGEALAEALQQLYRAIALDPGFASAYGLAAYCYVHRMARGWMTDRAQEIDEATRLARRAVALGRDDAYALCMGGFTLAYVARDFDGGIASIDRALTLNPNWATGWTLSGWTRVWRGEPETAIEQLARAIRLSPLDPLLFAMQSALAFAHFLVGRYDEATEWAKKALTENPKYLATLRIAAASNALAGRPEKAQQAMTRLRQLDPALRVSNLKDHISFRRSDDLIRYTEGLRKAGLPE